MPRIQVELVLCDGCGICVSVCPAFVLELFDEKVTIVNSGACLGIRAKQLCCGRPFHGAEGG